MRDDYTRSHLNGPKFSLFPPETVHAAGPMQERRLYLVCGLPGAGKTTRSRQIVAAVGAVHLCVDEWVVGLGVSLVDYEFRVRLQDCMLSHAATLLRAGVSLVL